MFFFFFNVFCSFILAYKIETEVRLSQVHVTLKHDVPFNLISGPECDTCQRQTQFVGAFLKSVEEFVSCKAHKHEQTGNSIIIFLRAGSLVLFRKKCWRRSRQSLFFTPHPNIIFPELAQVSLSRKLKLYRSVTVCAARYYHAVFYIQRNIKSILCPYF